MGFHSEQQIRADERGFDTSEKLVCSNCIHQDDLKKFVTSKADSQSDFCSFCGSHPAASINDLVDFFLKGVRNEFDDGSCLPNDKEDGYYLGAPLSSSKLVDDYYSNCWSEAVKVELLELVDDYYSNCWSEAVKVELLELVHDSFSWVQRDALYNREGEILYAWDRFSKQIKHSNRYTLWLTETHNPCRGEISFKDALSKIASTLEYHEIEAVTSLPPTQALWRARPKTNPDYPLTGKEMGTAPINKSQANRFSPTGIPLFYGAENKDTALREIGSTESEANTAKFHLTHEISVIDLANLPEPSPFNQQHGHLFYELKFLHKFADQISRPINKNPTLNYIPTQAFAEYLLRIHPFNNQGEVQIKGIAYKSSATQKTCYAIDIPNEHCLDLGNPGLKMSTLLTIRGCH